LQHHKKSYRYTQKTCVYGRSSTLFNRISAWAPIYVGDYSTYPTYENYHIVAFNPISSNKTLLASEESTLYFGNDSIKTNTSYAYDDYDQLSSFETNDSKGNVLKKENRYPYDDQDDQTNTSMVYSGVINPIIETNTYLNNTEISGVKTDYKTLSNSNIYIPKIFTKLNIKTKKGSGNYENEITFYKYGNYNTNSKHKLLEFITKENLSTTILWGYERKYPIAKIENATFSEVAQTLNLTETQLENLDESDLTQLNSLRNALPNSMVTTFTYDPLIGVTSITDPRGQTMYYHYDSFNRLEYVKDAEGSILSKNQYNYKN
jgi:YD repeat-containing protein